MSKEIVRERRKKDGEIKVKREGGKKERYDSTQIERDC